MKTEENKELIKPITLQMQVNAVFELKDGVPKLIRVDVEDCFPITASTGLITTPDGDTLH